MEKDRNEILAQMGFVHYTGTLWKHDKFGIFQIIDTETIKQVVSKVYERGYGECQVIIKASLGIKD